ncbi:MAG: efflux RND transporter permease subunit [Bacteriovoracaceae bacterium]
MKSLIKFFIENNKFTFVVTVFFVVVGVMGYMKLNAESYPSVSFAAATVVTSYYGASPEEIENEITKPIEDELRTVRGVKDVRSVSQSGLSNISIRVDMDNFDVDEVMDDLQKAVQRVTDLPAGIKERPKFTELNSEEFPAIELAVVGDNTDRKRDLFADYLKDLLEDNKRVLSARLTGFRDREFTILLNREKMNRYHISIEEVANVLRGRNLNIPSGDLKNDQTRFLVRLDGKVENTKQLEEIYIRSNFDGQSVQIKDVAKVVDGEIEARVLSKVNGEDATLMTVTKKAGEDTLALVADIEQKLNRVTIPDGLKIEVYNNESEKVKVRMEVLNSNAISGLVLVIFFLLIFLPGAVGIVASLSLPIAIMATVGLMPSFGMNLNTITILALVIALGMLVDNSVVISENYTRLRNEGHDNIDAAIKAAHQFWLPISCTVFTTIAAFVPMLVTKGVMGEFIKWIPIVVSLSLVLSLVESFFLLPMRLAFVGKVFGKSLNKAQQSKEGHRDWFTNVSDKFESFMHVLVNRRYLVAITFAGIIFGSLFMLIKVNDFILFPADQTEIYIGRYELPRGAVIERTNKVGKDIVNSIQDQIGEHTKNIVSRAGIMQSGPDDQKAKEGSNVGMIMIYMTREASIEQNYKDILTKLREIKHPEASVLTFEVLLNGPPVGSPVNVTFRSNNQAQLKGLSNRVVDYLASVDGIIQPQTDDVIGEDEVHIMIDYEKAARLGLDVNKIGNTVKTALEGAMITKLNLNNKKFELKVRYQDQDKKEILDLNETFIQDRLGNLIPISTIARIEKTEGTPIIKRFDFQRSKTVTADININKITSIEANKLVSEKFAELSKEFPEASIKFGGEEESTKESMSSLWEAMVLALMAILGILIFLFKSYLRPLIIMSTIPLGLLGFSIAFYFHNRPTSFLSLIGVIGLAGIIVNSGIVLISFIDQMRDEGALSLDRILARASGLRLRAVIVTSLTTISGLLPTAYGLGGEDAILIPMTLAMAWGLTSGTILTLVWVPCAYAILEDVTVTTDKLKSKVFGLFQSKDYTAVNDASGDKHESRI